MDLNRSAIAFFTLAVAACSGTVITTSDDMMGGQGGSTVPQGGAGHGGKGGASAKGGAPGSGGAPSAGGAPNAGGSPGAGGSAGCGELSSDPKHCGVCFHDCQGGACVSGLCQPVEIGQAGPAVYVNLVVDDSKLFLACTEDYHSWTISTMPKGGGGLVQILSDTNLGVLRIASLGQSLYLRTTPYEQGVSTLTNIFELPKSGGAMNSLWEDFAFGASPIATDEHDIYFTTADEVASFNRVIRMNPADETWELLAKVPGGTPLSIEADDSFVYVLVPIEPGLALKNIYRVPKAGGGEAEVMIENIDSPRMVQDSLHLYYLLQGQENPEGTNSLWRISKTGGKPVAVIDVPEQFSIGPASIDADRIWWIRRDADYGYKDVTVMKSPATGGAGTEVTTEVVRSNFVGDAEFLYWVRESGAIVRLAK